MSNTQTLTFSQRVAKSKSDSICLYTGRDKTGQTAWYFLLLSNGKKAKFSSKYKNDIDLAEYGKIIFSGHGKFPPSDIQALMQSKYGFF
jgi:hypothetical protein